MSGKSLLPRPLHEDHGGRRGARRREDILKTLFEVDMSRSRHFEDIISSDIGAAREPARVFFFFFASKTNETDSLLSTAVLNHKKRLLQTITIF